MSSAIVIGTSHFINFFDPLLVHLVSARATATATAKISHFPDHLVAALRYAGGPVGRGGRLVGIRNSMFLSFLVFATMRWR